MSDEEERKPDGVESSLEEMKIEGDMSDEEGSDTRCGGGVKEESLPSTPQPASFSHKRHTSEFIKRPPTSDSQSSTTSNKSSPSSSTNSDVHEETIGGEISIMVEPGKTPKLARTSTKTMAFKPPTLFDHFPDETEEATSHFEVIRDCIYGSKYMGSSDHDALGCDCNSEFDGKKNRACGEDSDCINRATKMECIDDECSCGAGCQNQRFQRKQFAKVSVIKTEKKGYGLRADTELRPADFIYEYIGEVINENHFRRRMVQYDEEGIKHFYFMSLSKGEFVDATKKGNLGRFCNHSCNPNCYVDKWVVGEKLRMGIFALRSIKAGEELVFNYNVDRYGADPQPCYCGEPNCTGFLGGKTQTERATKLPTQTIEALGIDDGDGWDTAVAKRPRKKKTGEDDEEYVNNLQPKALDERGATKVMATLMQCKEKWIAVKLLGRIQACEEDSVRHQVIRMHGYQILKSTLATFHDDVNVVLQVLHILHTLPRLTRNKILDSKIESSIEPLVDSEDERVASQASTLMKDWAALEMGYRIPRKAKDATDSHLNLPRHNIERRDYENFQPRQKSPSPEPPRGPAAPKGPRNSAPQRAPFPNGPRAGFPQGPGFQRPMTLPAGWQMAKAANGKPYFFSVSGLTQWTRPYQADRNPPPPPPPPPVSNEKKLQDIIDNITKEAKAKPKVTPIETPPPVVEVPKEKKKDKWKSLPKEKQMKIYENTLFPHIHYVMNKYKNKLPREDIKRFGKEMAKKLVNSDYKNDRVKDPNQISSSQVKQVKSYVKTFFDKAVVKRAEHDKKKAAQSADSARDSKKPNGPSPDTPVKSTEPDGEEKMDLSDDEVEVDDGKSTPLTTPSNPISNGTNGIKRKRDGDEESETGSVKRKRDEANVSETGSIKCKTEEDSVSVTASPKRKRELSEEGTPDSGSTPTKRQRSISPGFPPPPPPPMDGIDMNTGFQAGGILASTIDEEVAFMDAPPPPPIEEGQQFEEEVPGMENFAEGQVIQTSSAFLPASSGDMSQDLADSESPSEDQKSGLADHFEGMNHERLRQLGVPSEA